MFIIFILLQIIFDEAILINLNLFKIHKILIIERNINNWLKYVFLKKYVKIDAMTYLNGSIEIMTPI